MAGRDILCFILFIIPSRQFPPPLRLRSMQHEALTRTIIGCAMQVHRVLGPGFLESVYQNALAYELAQCGLAVEREKRVQVHYRDLIVGDFVADLVAERTVLVENKAARALIPAHEAQLVNYLTATGLDVGLLFNFGAERLQFRRKSRVYGGQTT